MSFTVNLGIISAILGIFGFIKWWIHGVSFVAPIMALVLVIGGTGLTGTALMKLFGVGGNPNDNE